MILYLQEVMPLYNEEQKFMIKFQGVVSKGELERVIQRLQYDKIEVKV